MSSSSKGTAREKLAADILKSRGYEILFRSYHTKFNRVDFANKFDIVANRRRLWLFVSVKSNYLPGEHYKKLCDWIGRNGFGNMVVLFFVWKKVKGKPAFYVYGASSQKPYRIIMLNKEVLKNAADFDMP